MQAWELNRKILVSLTKILEWCLHWNWMVYVSFSGGKDSTVLLDLVCRVWAAHKEEHGDAELNIVFVDTGLEYPEIREFVKVYIPWLMKKYNIKIKLVWLIPELNFRQVITKCGYPVIGKEQADYIHRIRSNKKAFKAFKLGLHKKPLKTLLKHAAFLPFVFFKCLFGITKKQVKRFTETEEMPPNRRAFKISKTHTKLIDAPFKVSHRCCYYMKKKPFYDYEKQTGRKPIIGVMADEGEVRNQAYLKYGCNAFGAERPKSTPLGPWKEHDIFEYITVYELPYCCVYGSIILETREGISYFHCTGVDRTGCMFCMFGVHLEVEPNRFQRMAVTHPKQYYYCMRPWDEGGLGLAEVLDYINAPYKVYGNGIVSEYRTVNGIVHEQLKMII